MDRRGEPSPAGPRLSMRGLCLCPSKLHQSPPQAGNNTAEGLSSLQQGCKVCDVESMCLETFVAQRPAVKEEEEGRHGCGISQAPWLPLPWVPRPASFPVLSELPAPLQLPGTGKALLRAQPVQKQVWHWERMEHFQSRLNLPRL